MTQLICRLAFLLTDPSAEVAQVHHSPSVRRSYTWFLPDLHLDRVHNLWMSSRKVLSRAVYRVNSSKLGGGVMMMMVMMLMMMMMRASWTHMLLSQVP